MSIRQLLASFGVPGAAASEGTIQTTVSIHNETQLKDLLDIGLPPERRAEHADALLDGVIAPAGNQHVALLHRLLRYAVGTG